MSFSIVPLSSKQNSQVDSLDSTLDNVFADGAGIQVSVSGITRSGSTVTVVTSGHNFINGQTVVLSPGETNFPAGTKTITSVSGNNFTYTEAGSTTANSTAQVFGSHSTQITSYSDDSKMSGGTGDTSTASNNRDLTRSVFRAFLAALIGALEGWTLVTPGGGWSNYDPSTYTSAGYCIDFFGGVKLKGLLTGGANGSGNVIMTLPIGYRPSKTMIFPAMSYDGTNTFCGQIRIDSTGIVYSMSPSANTWLSLDGIHFRAGS